MTVRCKFQLSAIKEIAWNQNQKIFEFTPQYDTSIPEDQRFNKYTPSGKFEMTVENPIVFEQFKLGEFYYFDISVAPQAEGESA